MSNYLENKSREEMIEEEIPVGTTPADGEVENLIPVEMREDDEDNFLYVRFKKPYDFEGTKYDGIDMTALEDVKGKDLTVFEKAFAKTGVVSSTPEMTSTYAKIVAAKVTGLPAEFFEGLPVREIVKVKGAVIRFFYNED